MRFLPLLIAVVLILPTGCVTGDSSVGSTSGAAAGGKVDFVSEVKPILQDRCVMCHNRRTLPNRTSFENAKLALKGDAQGPVIVPGKGSASRLVTAITLSDVHETAMPPVSHRVSKQERDLLRRWIDEGAHWPSGLAGSLRPPLRPRE